MIKFVFCGASRKYFLKYVIIGGSLFNISAPVPATAQLLKLPIGALQQPIAYGDPGRTITVGNDPNSAPPMDTSAINGIFYMRDDLGRPTFLGPSCLSEIAGSPAASDCISSAIRAHQSQIDQIAESQRMKEEFQRAAVAQVERQRVEAAATEIAEQQRLKKQAEDLAGRDRLDKLPSTHAQMVARCKAAIRRYLANINEERRIGQFSGAVDLNRLHQNGDMIERTRQQMMSEYRKYRQLGGKEPLSAL